MGVRKDARLSTGYGVVEGARPHAARASKNPPDWRRQSAA